MRYERRQQEREREKKENRIKIVLCAMIIIGYLLIDGRIDLQLDISEQRTLYTIQIKQIKICYVR